jgi:uncharacterized protein YuzE
MQNNESPNDDDDDLHFTEKDIQEIEELLVDTAELKKVAARTLLRATHIIDSNPNDTDVAYLLLHEATVMMQIVHRIESFFNDDESGK